MDSFDNQLREMLQSKEPPTSDAASAAGEKLISEFRRRHERILMYATIGHIGFGLLLGFCFGIMHGHRGGFWAASQMALVGTLAGLGLVVMKLWYWILTIKLDIVREIKMLRLQMLSREAVLAASDGAVSVLADLQERNPLLLKAIRWGIFASAILGYLIGLLLR
jgi:hypothetical protein